MDKIGKRETKLNKIEQTLLNYEEKNEIIGIDKSGELKYQNLLYMPYESKVFLNNEDYDLDYVKFNQIISNQSEYTYH